MSEIRECPQCSQSKEYPGDKWSEGHGICNRCRYNSLQVPITASERSTRPHVYRPIEQPAANPPVAVSHNGFKVPVHTENGLLTKNEYKANPRKWDDAIRKFTTPDSHIESR